MKIKSPRRSIFDSPADTQPKMPRHHHPLHRLPAAAGTASLGAAAAAAAAFLLLCALALAACASHSGRFFRRRRCSEPVIINHQVQPGAEEECVWQKSILMGGKCELPDFSGVVSYDSAGNLIVAGRPRPTMSLK